MARASRASTRATERARVAARILVVDDSPDTLELVQRNLASQGHAVFTATSVADALAVLESVAPDLVVTDMRMPGMSGMDLIRELRARHPRVEVIVITGYATIEGAVEAVRGGALDYLAKPFTDEELFAVVRRSLARREAEDSGPAAPTLLECGGLLGRSEAMRSLFEALAGAAKGAKGVLVRGEPGAGREATARALHALAGDTGPFLRVSLDARSHGPAGVDPAGALAAPARAAAGGTLYLAALDVADPGVLRAVEGLLAGARGKGALPARVVASVTAEPADLRGRGPEMAGLLERFPVALVIPPLRERGDDAVHLARRFLAESAAAAGTAVRTLSEPASQALRAYAWPGNVRELRDLSARWALPGRSGPVDASELPAAIAGALGREAGADLSMGAAERAHIESVLRRAGGNKSRAAGLLGIDRKTLRDKLRGGREGGPG